MTCQRRAPPLRARGVPGVRRRRRHHGAHVHADTHLVAKLRLRLLDDLDELLACNSVSGRAAARRAQAQRDARRTGCSANKHTPCEGRLPLCARPRTELHRATPRRARPAPLRTRVPDACQGCQEGATRRRRNADAPEFVPIGIPGTARAAPPAHSPPALLANAVRGARGRTVGHTARARLACRHELIPRQCGHAAWARGRTALPALHAALCAPGARAAAARARHARAAGAGPRAGLGDGARDALPTAGARCFRLLCERNARRSSC